LEQLHSSSQVSSSGSGSDIGDESTADISGRFNCECHQHFRGSRQDAREPQLTEAAALTLNPQQKQQHPHTAELTGTAAHMKQLADASSIAITAPFNFCMLNAEEGVLKLSEIARMCLYACSLTIMHDLHLGLAFTVHHGCRHLRCNSSREVATTFSISLCKGLVSRRLCPLIQ